MMLFIRKEIFHVQFSVNFWKKEPRFVLLLLADLRGEALRRVGGRRSVLRVLPVGVARRALFRDDVQRHHDGHTPPCCLRCVSGILLLAVCGTLAGILLTTVWGALTSSGLLLHVWVRGRDFYRQSQWNWCKALLQRYTTVTLILMLSLLL